MLRFHQLIIKQITYFDDCKKSNTVCRKNKGNTKNE